MAKPASCDSALRTARAGKRRSRCNMLWYTAAMPTKGRPIASAGSMSRSSASPNRAARRGAVAQSSRAAPAPRPASNPKAVSTCSGSRERRCTSASEKPSSSRVITSVTASCATVTRPTAAGPIMLPTRMNTSSAVNCCAQKSTADQVALPSSPRRRGGRAASPCSGAASVVVSARILKLPRRGIRAAARGRQRAATTASRKWKARTIPRPGAMSPTDAALRRMPEPLAAPHRRRYTRCANAQTAPFVRSDRTPGK